MMTKKIMMLFVVVCSCMLMGADEDSMLQTTTTDRYQGPPIEIIYCQLPDGSVVHPYQIPAKYRAARITTAAFVEIVVEDVDKDRGTP